MRTIERLEHDVATSPPKMRRIWVIVADGGDLTPRQEEMIAMLDDYTQAWVDGDSAAVVGFFAASGYLDVAGVQYYVADGSLAAYVDMGFYGSLESLAPRLVYGHEVLGFGRLFTSGFDSNYTFTPVGDVQLLSHVVSPAGTYSYTWP